MENLDPVYALNEIPHPTVIVTVGNYGENGRYNGMTAAWISRVSWDPPMVMVSISPKRYTWKLIKEYREFAVNIVSEKLKEAAIEIFGKLSGRDVDKFAESKVKVVKGRSIDAPVILDAPIIIECKVENIVETGDHYIIIGRAVDAYRNVEGKPILWYRRKPYSIGVEL